MKTINEILDKVLADLYRERKSRFNPDLYLKERFQLEDHQAQGVFEKLQLNDLVDFANRKSMTISEKGMRIQTEYGGWLAYLRLQEENEAKQEERQQKEDEKLDLDLTLAKWQKKVFWPLFFIALLGGIPQLIEWMKTLVDLVRK